MADPPDDIWTLHPASGQADGPPSGLTVATVRDIAPLDAQIGVAAPLTVPPALRAPLFECDEAGADPFTYAVLDAAKVPGLAETLTTSGLDHACLFQGAAADDLRDVAPWIVRLQVESSFTRALFTRGDTPWTLWDAEPGIFLRATAPIGALRAHLRKYTRVRDERGTWLYWRFWEGAYLAPTLRAMGAPERRAFFMEGAVASIWIVRTKPAPTLTGLTLEAPSASSTAAETGRPSRP